MSSDPPMDVSGMTRVILDVRGRLVKFEAIPPQSERQTSRESANRLEPRFSPKQVWTSITTERPNRSGRRLFLQMKEKPGKELTLITRKFRCELKPRAFTWQAGLFSSSRAVGQASRETQFTARLPEQKLPASFSAVVFFCALIAALVAARHNLKVGRGDTKGALRLVLFIFSVITLAQLITADHVPTLSGEISIFFQIASLALFYRRTGLGFLYCRRTVCSPPLVGVDYFLEPAFGRRFSRPDGRAATFSSAEFWDYCHTAAIYSMFLMPHWLGYAVPPLDGSDRETLMGMRGIVGHTLFGLGGSGFLCRCHAVSAAAFSRHSAQKMAGGWRSLAVCVSCQRFGICQRRSVDRLDRPVSDSHGDGRLNCALRIARALRVLFLLGYVLWCCDHRRLLKLVCGRHDLFLCRDHGPGDLRLLHFTRRPAIVQRQTIGRLSHKSNVIT